MNKLVGTVYVVATPIGNLQDMSKRGCQILQSVDCILAEDCRHSKKLLNAYGINTPLESLHAHNEQSRIDSIIERCQQGQQFALISDAGTPLISDPGSQLIAMLREAGVNVVPIPGPSALITALSASGLPSHRFIFEGFLPVKAGARLQHLQSLRHDSRTLIFYEAPHRIKALVEQCLQVFGEDRLMCLARELTKIHETFIRGSIAECWQQLSNPDNTLGEFVVLVAGAAEVSNAEQPTIDVDALLQTLLKVMSVKQAALEAAALTGLKKNPLYQRALELIA